MDFCLLLYPGTISGVRKDVLAHVFCQWITHPPPKVKAGARGVLGPTTPLGPVVKSQNQGENQVLATTIPPPLTTSTKDSHVTRRSKFPPDCALFQSKQNII